MKKRIEHGIGGLELEIYDAFGGSVAVSSDGNTLAVGARGDNTTSLSNTGAVHIFKKTTMEWEHTRKIDGTISELNLVTNDYFGTSVTLSGDSSVLAVGAMGDDTGGQNRGSVYLFSLQGEEWVYTEIINSNTEGLLLEDNDLLGSAVTFSDDGNILVIGARYNNTGGTNRGVVFVMIQKEGVWTYDQRKDATTEDVTLSDEDSFGSSIALSPSEETLYVGAVGNDADGDGSGAVHMLKITIPVFFAESIENQELNKGGVVQPITLPEGQR